MSQLDKYCLLTLDRYVSDMLSIKANSEGNIGIRLIRLFLKLLEYSGHGIPWITVTLYMIYQTHDTKTRLFFCNLLMALFIDLVIVGLLKMLVRRPRPVYNKDDMFATVSVDRYSFPSGHSTRVVMVAVLFTCYLTSSFYIKSCFIWAAMVSISRVVLGRHYVSDVMGGAIIGYLQYFLVAKYWLNEETLEQAFDILNL